MNQNPKCRFRACTLVEVLICLAVITVLAARVLPALARGKQQVLRVDCANNLKQVALAFRVWAGDNADRYPMAMVGQPGGPPHGYTFTVSGGAPNPPPVAGGWTYTYDVFQIMSNEYATPNIVVCPADDRTAQLFIRNNLSISYFYGKDAEPGNPAMFLAGDRAIASGSNNNAGYGVSPNGAPGGAVLSLGTNFQAGTSFPQWTKALHGGTGNIAFIDGSVQNLTGVGLRQAAMRTGDNSESSLGHGSYSDNCLIFP